MREKVGYLDLPKFGFRCALKKPGYADMIELIEVHVKYSGYIERELGQIERMKKIEKVLIAPDFDYIEIKGLSKESRELLMKYRPHNLGQASRLQGVTPAEISLLMVYLSSKKGKK